jgi:hypothetical protein
MGPRVGIDILRERKGCALFEIDPPDSSVVNMLVEYPGC